MLVNQWTEARRDITSPFHRLPRAPALLCVFQFHIHFGLSAHLSLISGVCSLKATFHTQQSLHCILFDVQLASWLLTPKRPNALRRDPYIYFTLAVLSLLPTLCIWCAPYSFSFLFVVGFSVPGMSNDFGRALSWLCPTKRRAYKRLVWFNMART